jgi:hypothetical protein
MDIKKLTSLLEAAISCIPEETSRIEDVRHMQYAYLDVPEILRTRILELLRDQPELEMYINNKLFNLGGGLWKSVDGNMLLQWLLNTSIDKGIEEALSNLEKYIKLSSLPATEVLVFSGIAVDESFELSHGISLVPFSQLPSSLQKLELGKIRPNPLDPLSLENDLPKAALIRKNQIKPKFINHDENIRKYISVDKKLDETCKIITLLNGCTPFKLAHWFEMEDWVPCSAFLNGGFVAPIHDVVNNTLTKLDRELVNELKHIQSAFMNLKQTQRDVLHIPIWRTNQSRRRSELVDKVIDLGIAFESFYLDTKEQISFTFRLRAAWYLGATKEDRENIMITLKTFYDCRSAAVHKGHVDRSVKVKNRGKINTVDLLKESDKLCVDSIRKVIDQGGFPDWDDLVLGV